METEIQKLNRQVQDLQNKLNSFLDVYTRTHFIDKDVFNNPVTFNNNITLGKTGTKVGFLGKAPIAQQTTITTPSGGATVDSQARSSIGEIKTLLTNLGLTA